MSPALPQASDRGETGDDECDSEGEPLSYNTYPTS